MGRPSKFTPEIAASICEAIASTPRGLDYICGTNEEFPSAKTVHAWLNEHEDFRKSYVLARERQADLLFDECLEIADNAAQDTILLEKNGCEIELPDKEWILRSKLRVDTRMRMAGKLAPKKYGDKQEVTHQPGDGFTEFLTQIRNPGA
ncbi:hypothetical protein TSACC_21696 [Terrimicrobium sacchariphilum]|uniref:Phage terminase small subunit n=1 Tax=Terrimicrobium sacchariphilum TaxID=690879 RepID=A0A146G7F3_TERSA|nr:hypothetical protein [Terrimicrobium sacchariphilum]GAT33283.1 hypothetical protein TSACC_21696 [Terrimicrobium sacchariphilum]